MCLEPAQIKVLKQFLTIIKLHCQANREISDRFQDKNRDSTIFHRQQETCNCPEKSVAEQIFTLKDEL